MFLCRMCGQGLSLAANPHDYPDIIPTMVAEQDPLEFEVCVGGPKCAGKYALDCERNNRGTGDLPDDIESEAKRIGIRVTVKRSGCLDLCPGVGIGPSVLGPEGVVEGYRLRRPYFPGIAPMLEEFGQARSARRQGD